MLRSTFGKILAISGFAITVVGIAMFRKNMQNVAAGALLKAKEQWQRDKVKVVKEKEALEEKVNELESTVERMARDVEILRSSLIEKQKEIALLETKKERNKNTEMNYKKDYTEQVEQLTKRAQQFLKQLQEKTNLCDQQHELITSLEMKQEILTQSNWTLRSEVVKSEEAIKEFMEDLRPLIAQYVKEHGELAAEVSDWKQIIRASAGDSQLTNMLSKWKHLLLSEAPQFNA